MFKTVNPWQWNTSLCLTFFFSLGVYQSFWSVWLEQRAVSEAFIGVILGCGAATRGICNLMLTPFLSRVFQALSTCFLLAGCLALAHCWIENVWLLFLMTQLFNVFYAPIIPLMDVILNRFVTLKLLDYGRVRLWGTGGFILGIVCIGQVLDGVRARTANSVPNVGANSSWQASWQQVQNFMSDHGVVLIVSAALLVTWILSLRQVKQREVISAGFERIRWQQIVSVWQDSSCTRILLVVTLLQASHGAFFSYGVIWWEKLGFSYSTISLFWGCAMVAEMIIFAYNKSWFENWSLQNMVFLSGAGVVLRWIITAFSDEMAFILLAQVLHALSFGLTHLIMMRFIQAYQPQRAIVLQALYNGLSMSLCLGLVSILSGWIFAAYQGWVFVAAALLGLSAFLVPIAENSVPWWLKRWQRRSLP
jgi:PPP family 3-phenylpropionic acid transporter